ncbi:MAG: peptide chain release factor N(5)-glutamine methyltransferase [Flavobacteriales bacterium]|jgi:release factor glutamine methyltransferase|nr:peptide chain release factor N(5)-glutamine methyltransferase [Flavobacteriales bacterium]
MTVKITTLRDWKKRFQKELASIYDSLELNSLFSILISDRYSHNHAHLLYIDDPIQNTHLDQLEKDLKRLKANEPIQHILGYAYFDDLKIAVNSHVLVPRQETEELVDWISQNLQPNNKVLDLCTGSGCIALALKNRKEQINVLGIDLSNPALEIAKQNAENLKLSVTFIQENVLETWNIGKEQFDIIVSNPPYIPIKEKEEIHANVKDFDPEMALFVPDETPLLFYKKIAIQSLDYLKENGLLFFEIHKDFGQETVALLADLGYKDIELRKDLNGLDRMIKAKK